MAQQVTFQLRRGFSTGSTGWAVQNPTLAAGEPGVELDTSRIKIGNGSQAWNSLPYLSAVVPIAGGTGIGVAFNGTTYTVSSELVKSNNAIALGSQAGQTGQGGSSIAIGTQAGRTGQRDNAIAIGTQAGFFNQNVQAVALGYYAGSSGQTAGAVAIGWQAGQTGQGNSSIAIGKGAGTSFQANSTIILNASGSEFNGVDGQANSFYVKPIRRDRTQRVPLCYDADTSEVVYSSPVGVSGGTGIRVSVPTGPDSGQAGPTFVIEAAITGGTGIQLGLTGLTYVVSLAPYSQGDPIIFGFSAGGSAGTDVIAIGHNTSMFTSDNTSSVCIGGNAGETGQHDYCIAIGGYAGNSYQATNSVAVGDAAGQYNQGGSTGYSVAIGSKAGQTGQGPYAIAIGANAGNRSQRANSIILNASGNFLDGVDRNNIGLTSAFFVKPIRVNTARYIPLMYDPTTSEIVQGGCTFGVTFCGTQFKRDIADGGNPGNSVVYSPPTGYGYVDIGINGVTANSVVHVWPASIGYTGLKNVGDWGSILTVQLPGNGAAANNVRVWTQTPGLSGAGYEPGSLANYGTTYAGLYWNVISLGPGTDGY